jgi:peptidylglycine monooxygenase
MSVSFWFGFPACTLILIALYRYRRRTVDTQISVDGLQVVLGSHRYAFVHPWNRVHLGHVSQLALDSIGRVYVFQRTGSPIVVLTPDGELAGSWGTGQISDPHGIFITADDRVLLVDRDAHQVMIFDTSGQLRATLGERQHPRFGLPFNHPTDVAVAPTGEIYVCDGYGNAHVHCFSADGKYRFTWGGIGTGPGQFSTPHGIWVAADGRVLVADRENNRIQVFAGDGAYLSEWSDLYHPMDIYGDADGTIFVTDQAPRIVAFSPKGEVLGRCKSVATHSHGIWGDKTGNLFLCEHNGRLSKLARLS